MVHFNLSTRVNFAGKRRLKFWSLQGTKSAHNLFLTNQALRICFDPNDNDSFQSFGMPLADYYSSVCILSSRLISFFVRCFLFHFWGDFIRFHFVENGFAKTSRNGEKASLWTYALTFSPSEVLDNSVWLTWCYKTSHDINCKPVIILGQP